jgi:hypothetical protein
MKHLKRLIATRLSGKSKLPVLLLMLFFSQNAWAYPFPLSDTGQTKCYNNTVEIACSAAGEAFYGQDASYLINPPSYTKLDVDGDKMVQDNVTGLTWEVKTDDGSVHDKDNTYT